MTYRFEAWRRRLKLWAIPFAFCAVNLLAFVVYQTAFADSVSLLNTDIKKAERDLAALEAERQTGEFFLERVEDRDRSIDELHDVHFSTESRRFVTWVTEAKNLARRAGLRPSNYSYPETKLEEEGLDQRKIIFSVEGSYDQLRNFVNFLELTEQFLTLERVTLNETGSQGQTPILSIQLELSTIFVDEEGDETETRPRRRRGVS